MSDLEARKRVTIIKEILDWFNASKPASSAGETKDASDASDALNTPRSSAGETKDASDPFNTPSKASKDAAIKWLNGVGFDTSKFPPLTEELTPEAKNKIIEDCAKRRYVMTFTSEKERAKFWKALTGKTDGDEAKTKLEVDSPIGIIANKGEDQIEVQIRFATEDFNVHNYTKNELYKKGTINNLYSRIKEKVFFCGT